MTSLDKTCLQKTLVLVKYFIMHKKTLLAVLKLIKHCSFSIYLFLACDLLSFCITLVAVI